MLAISLGGFLAFLQSAVFLVGYISNNSLFPEPLSSEDEQKYLELLKKEDKTEENNIHPKWILESKKDIKDL